MNFWEFLSSLGCCGWMGLIIVVILILGSLRFVLPIALVLLVAGVAAIMGLVASPFMYIRKKFK